MCCVHHASAAARPGRGASLLLQAGQLPVRRQPSHSGAVAARKRAGLERCGFTGLTANSNSSASARRAGARLTTDNAQFQYQLTNLNGHDALALHRERQTRPIEVAPVASASARLGIRMPEKQRGKPAVNGNPAVNRVPGCEWQPALPALY
eukprot:scaffold33457_cov90-Isochrysis_galbana.AAC.3